MGSELRKHPRRKISAKEMIYTPNGEALVKCAVRDVSASGAQLILDSEKTLPRKFVLLMSTKVRRDCTLVWQFSIMAGARFSETTR